MEKLQQKWESTDCSIYELEKQGSARLWRYIATTPETRAICNDPHILGVDFTASLEKACAKVLRGFAEFSPITLEEKFSSVLNVLRGGLNFGIREALASAYDWNCHSTIFISTQRLVPGSNGGEFLVTETPYQKILLPPECSIVFGDVVATGTTLSYAMERVLDLFAEQKSKLQSILFFTIGGSRAAEALLDLEARCLELNPAYEGAVVVYLEGVFKVASPSTKLSVMLTGTDLLRREATLAPEFLASQYSNPAYPVERCAVYDAASRAYCITEYLEDVRSYWEETLRLAHEGMSYADLVKERFPEFNLSHFGYIDLVQICEKELARFQDASSLEISHTGTHVKPEARFIKLVDIVGDSLSREN